MHTEFIQNERFVSLLQSIHIDQHNYVDGIAAVSILRDSFKIVLDVYRRNSGSMELTRALRLQEARLLQNFVDYEAEGCHNPLFIQFLFRLDVHKYC